MLLSMRPPPAVYRPVILCPFLRGMKCIPERNDFDLKYDRAFLATLRKVHRGLSWGWRAVWVAIARDLCWEPRSFKQEDYLISASSIPSQLFLVMKLFIEIYQFTPVWNPRTSPVARSHPHCPPRKFNPSRLQQWEKA